MPCNTYADDCQKEQASSDEVKMLEIKEAIHDLDSKLTNLEIALNLNGKN